MVSTSIKIHAHFTTWFRANAQNSAHMRASRGFFELGHDILPAQSTGLWKKLLSFFFLIFVVLRRLSGVLRSSYPFGQTGPRITGAVKRKLKNNNQVNLSHRPIDCACKMSSSNSNRPRRKRTFSLLKCKPRRLPHYLLGFHPLCV